MCFIPIWAAFKPLPAVDRLRLALLLFILHLRYSVVLTVLMATFKPLSAGRQAPSPPIVGLATSLQMKGGAPVWFS